MASNHNHLPVEGPNKPSPLFKISCFLFQVTTSIYNNQWMNEMMVWLIEWMLIFRISFCKVVVIISSRLSNNFVLNVYSRKEISPFLMQLIFSIILELNNRIKFTIIRDLLLNNCSSLESIKLSFLYSSFTLLMNQCIKFLK